MTNDGIRLENVTRIYTRDEKGFILKKKTRDKILDSVNLHIQPGVVTGIIGSSGSGKSVLARLMVLAEKPSEGSVFIGNEDASKLSGKALKKLAGSIGYIEQDAHIRLNLNAGVSEVVGGIKPSKNTDNPEDTENNNQHDRIRNALQKVGISPDAIKKKAVEFSGGQRQLLTIAGGLINNPDYIIADQPLNALDPETKRNMAQYLKQLARNEHKTVVLIAHQLEIVSEYTDQLIVLEQGKVIETGETKAVFKNPQHEITQKLIGFHKNYMDLPSILAEKKEKIASQNMP